MDMLTIDLTDIFGASPPTSHVSLDKFDCSGDASNSNNSDISGSMDAWLSMHPAIGCTVELWGKNIDINVIASMANTISYELLCNMKRVPKTYTKLQK